MREMYSDRKFQNIGLNTIRVCGADTITNDQDKDVPCGEVRAVLINPNAYLV